MLFKKTFTKLKSDFKEDKKNLEKFYANPNKYLSKTHVIVRVLLVLYVVGFLLILKFTPENADFMFYRLIYIIFGYFTLSFLHDYLRVK